MHPASVIAKCIDIIIKYANFVGFAVNILMIMAAEPVTEIGPFVDLVEINCRRFR